MASKEYNAIYYAAHKEQRAEYNAKWRIANLEHYREYQVAYQAAHKERSAAAHARWRIANPEYQAAYDKANPDKQRERNATRRARKADAFIEAIDRQVVFSRDAGTCGICQQGVAPEGWHLDHVIPLSKGGLHSYDNVQVSHPVCNQSKGAR